MTTITASSTIGINLNSGLYTNPIVIDAGVSIDDGSNAIFASTGSWTIQNAGSLAGTGTSGHGILLVVPSARITNATSGSITGGYAGIVLSDGGSVTNAASASISGGSIGVQVQIGGNGTVVNAGSIVGTS